MSSYSGFLFILFYPNYQRALRPIVQDPDMKGSGSAA